MFCMFQVRLTQWSLADGNFSITYSVYTTRIMSILHYSMTRTTVSLIRCYSIKVFRENKIWKQSIYKCAKRLFCVLLKACIRTFEYEIFIPPTDQQTGSWRYKKIHKQIIPYFVDSLFIRSICIHCRVFLLTKYYYTNLMPTYYCKLLNFIFRSWCK